MDGLVSSIFSSIPTAGIAGALIGGLTVFLGFLTNRRKSDIDLTGKVLAEWEKLTTTHKEQIESLIQRVKLLEEENANLRERVRHLEDELSACKRSERDLTLENTGLQRQLGQIAESSGIIALEEGSATARGISRYHQRRDAGRAKGDALAAAEKTVDAAEEAVEKVKKEKKRD